MNFKDSMQFRHACKAFDLNQKISPEDEAAILDFGRMSPSSFGIEPWHFLVLKEASLREKLHKACWDQVQITSSSFVVVYLTYLPHHFRGDTDLLRQRLWRRSLEEARYQTILQRVQTYLAEQNTLEWAKRQSYIALANMMTGAASLGIDSCPMEGFHSEKVKAVLCDVVDWHTFDVSMLCAFGHRVKEQNPHIREPIESVMTCV